MMGIYTYELKTLLTGLKAYIFTAFMILSGGIFVAYWNLYNGVPSTEYSLAFITVPLMAAIPFLTFSSYSGERAAGADIMLSSIGVKTIALTVSKFLAYMTVFTFSFVFLLIVPFIFAIFADINIAGALSGLLGYYLYGAALMALCLFVSSVTTRPLYSAIASYSAVLITYLCEIVLLYIADGILASFFLLSVLILLSALVVYYLTRSETVCIIFAVTLEIIVIILRFTAPDFFAGIFGSVMGIFALRDPLSGFLYGLLDLTCVVKYAVITAVFLLLTRLSLLSRRSS